MGKIAVIVLNFNGKNDTLACIKSLQKMSASLRDVNIIVVDNESSDDSVTAFKLIGEGITLIKNENNLGYAGGNNIGVQFAFAHDAEYVLIINNDTVVDKNLLRELEKVIDQDSNIGIVVPKIYFAKGYEFHKNRYKKEDLGKIIWYAGGIMDWNNVIGHHRGVDEIDNGQYDRQEETDFASGNCMLIKKEVFDKVGMFDKKYFLYYEDSDFSMKVRKAGFKIFFVPKAMIWHKNAASAGGSGSFLQDYYITRNRLLFGMRYAPLRAKIALIRESLRMLTIGRKWQKRGVIDFYSRKLGKGSFPI